MTKSRLVDNLIKVLTALGAGMGIVITLVSIFAPTFISNTTGQFISGLRASDGSLREEAVAAQFTVFIVTVLIFAAIAGLALAGLYYWSTGIDARSVAGGGKHDKLLRWIALGGTGLICIFVGLFLPSAIFSNTNRSILASDFSLAAMAANSSVGGFIFGVIIFAVSVIFASAFYFLFIRTPWQVRRNKVLKSFAV